MTVDSRQPLTSRGSLKDQLKAKGRSRREGLSHLATSASLSTLARNDLLPPIELVTVPVADLRAPARNVRTLDPAHVREVVKAIRALGFRVPLLIDDNNRVIDGMIRVEAAKLCGIDRIPCIRTGHLSDDEKRLMRMAVNRLPEKGKWNLDELKIELTELILADAPIEISGFDSDEIDQIIIGDAAEAIETGPLAPTADDAPVARLGDMFQLGPHRLICGDARDPGIISRLLTGVALACLVVTDEPYNVKIAGNVTRGDHREFAMASGEMSAEDFLTFNQAWMEAVVAHLRDGGVLGTFIDWRGAPTVAAAADRLGLTPLNLIVWAKTNAGMGSLYRSAHELLPLYKKGNAAHVNNVELGKRGRWRSNVWTYPGASAFGSDARRGLEDHPTVKPTAMLQDALLDLTNRGDIVLDPFLGSGSTLIAAEQVGRVCMGVELDPLYVDVAIRRYEAATGKSAVLSETGESFAEVAASRSAEAAQAQVI